MKYLVTGGAGFIGSAVCRHLAKKATNSVVNLDSLTYAGSLTSLEQLKSSTNYKFVHGDIRDRALLRSIFMKEKPEAIIHLAAETHVDRSISGADDFISTNIEGTYNLLVAAVAYTNHLDSISREQFRFLHVSTDEVYGSLGKDDLFTESTLYDPSSPYSASKAASDHLCMAWHRTYGLPVIISNCSNNYGPFQFPEKLIPLTILNAIERKPLPVYGKGANVRDWLYVDDHVHALVSIIERGKPGHKYNVGGRNERTNLEVVQTICKLVDNTLSRSGSEDLITFVADRPGHDLRYAIDPFKIEAALGWKANQNFESGLAKTVNWYLQNEWWWRPLREQRYAGNRLGLIEKN